MAFWKNIFQVLWTIPAVLALLASGAVGLAPRSSVQQAARGRFLELLHPTSVSPVQEELSAQTPV